VKDSPLLKLTIGIPTYNRSDFLKDSIESIACQMASLEEDVEILVCDNASTDATSEVVQALQAKYPNLITYHRNTENLGYDRNVDAVFKHARASYVWLLGDDDVHLPHSLSTMLQAFEAYPEAKVYLANFSFYDEDMETCIGSGADVLQGRMFQPETKDDFIIHSNARYASLSALCISRQAWNTLELSSGFGCQYIHVFALFHVLTQGAGVIIPDVLLKTRAGSPNVHKVADGSILICLKFFECLKLLKPLGYSPKACSTLLQMHQNYTVGTFKAAGRQGLEKKWHVIFEVAKHLWNYPPMWLKLRYLL
jgi:glycosyltransferase involved in cell wall biosynthesis